MRVAFATAAVAAFALLTFPGCGPNEAPFVGATVPVKGKITYKGQPLTQGGITFEPVDDSRPANGSIKPDGTFVLTTFKEGDGAVVGVHRVGVTDAGKAGKEVVPKKFASPRASKVEVEVTEGKSDYTIDLK
jgi:hypothetical protein